MKQAEELKHLKCKMYKLEHHLKVSEDKCLRLAEEVNTLNGELARHINRSPSHRLSNNSGQSPVTGALTGSLDYKNKLPNQNNFRKNQSKPAKFNLQSENCMSSSDQEEDEEPISEDTINRYSTQAFRSNSNTLEQVDSLRKSAESQQNSKIILRHHERLFDRKIVNSKRFSQVVMVDEDEIFQLNDEISHKPTNDPDNNTLKFSSSSNYDTKSYQQPTETPNAQLRFMEHLSEEETEEGGNDEFGYNQNNDQLNAVSDKLSEANHHSTNVNSTEWTNFSCKESSANLKSSYKYLQQMTKLKVSDQDTNEN